MNNLPTSIMFFLLVILNLRPIITFIFINYFNSQIFFNYLKILITNLFILIMFLLLSDILLKSLLLFILTNLLEFLFLILDFF